MLKIKMKHKIVLVATLAALTLLSSFVFARSASHAGTDGTAGEQWIRFVARAASSNDFFITDGSVMDNTFVPAPSGYRRDQCVVSVSGKTGKRAYGDNDRAKKLARHFSLYAVKDARADGWRIRGGSRFGTGPAWRPVYITLASYVPIDYQIVCSKGKSHTVKVMFDRPSHITGNRGLATVAQKHGISVAVVGKDPYK